MDIFTVVVSEKAKDNLRTVPAYIARKVGSWIDSVAHDGLMAVRKIPGFHDEPLKVVEKASAPFDLTKRIGQFM